MRKTTNYGLALYDKEDKMSITAEENSLNANMEIIDNALKDVANYMEENKDNIIQEIIETLGTPVFGTIDDENNIILTGELTEGTYTFKYEDGEGNTTTIGSHTIGSNTSVVYSAKAGNFNYDSTNKIIYLDDVTTTAYTYGYVYSNGNHTGVYTEVELTNKSDTVKPILIPEGATKVKVNFPNLTEEQLAGLRIGIYGLTYDAENDHYVRGGVMSNTEYGVLEQTLPPAEYVLIKFNASGYPNLTTYDLSNVEVSWE